MHLALYRKYRPRTFDEVVGQDHVTTTLKNEVKSGAPAHAYLFTGSRGTGKTSCAKILAKAINCPNPVDGNPCGSCEICRGIDDGSMMDVLEIDAASNNGVDNIRDLRDAASFTPATGRYRVYIIDEVHMLSAGAFNALLKIMEEPPAHVVFILATTEVHKVLATILSRCQRFDFRRIPSEQIAAALLEIARKEGFSLTEDAALLIGHLSDGGMRDAISLLDLCSSYSTQIDRETVTQAAGVVGQSHLFSLSDCITRQDSRTALTLIDQLAQRSLDPERLCEQLIRHYRNLLLARAMGDPGDLVDVLPADRPELARQAKQQDMQRLLYILTALQDALGRMSRTNQRRTQLEMAVIRLCDPRLTDSNEALAARVEQLEIALRTGVPSQGTGVTVSPSAAGEEAPMPIPEPAPLQEELPVPMPAPQRDKPRQEALPFPAWPQVLERVKNSNAALYGALCNSDAYQSGNYILVAYKDDLFVKMMRTNEYSKESLKQAIFEVTGQRFAIGPYDQEKYAVKTTPAADPLEQFLQGLSLPEDQVIIK